MTGPGQMVVDSSGNLFFVDGGNDVIREVVASSGVIETVAGGAENFANGIPATHAELYDISGLAIDSSGNLYISESAWEVVRKVTASSGLISTIAGNGTSGYSGDGGAATSAELDSPQGLAVDSSGNVYIADSGNNVIREMTESSGDISTVAGDGTAGYTGDGGAATSAELHDPQDLAFDSSGNLYISDSDNCVVRKISSGDISTFAGDGSCGDSGDGGAATSAELNEPQGLAFDSSGDLFIALPASDVVREVDAGTGIVNVGVGSSDTGLYDSYGVAVDSSGDVFVEGLDTIWEESATPPPITLSPSALSFSGFVGTWSSPQTVTVTNSGLSNLSISTIAITGANTSDFLIGGDSCADTTITPTSTCTVSVGFVPTDSGPRAAKLTFTDSGSGSPHEVYLYGEAQGYPSKYAGTSETPGYSGDGGPATAAEMGLPGRMVLDSSGNLFFVDGGNDVIREVVASSGVIKTVAGGGYSYADGVSATSAELYDISGLTIDSSGNLYIAETAFGIVRKVTESSGLISTIAGDYTTGYAGDGGAATSAELDDPQGLAVDSSGNVYIADSGNNVIRKVTASSGLISTIAGNGTAGYTGDGGAATSAELNGPQALAFAPSGDLYISDSSNCVVRKISSGDISTYAGDGGCGNSYGGPATSAELDDPQGLAFDSSGDLFIAVPASDSVREVNVSTGFINLGVVGVDSGLFESQDVAVDSTGDVFVGGYDTIWEISRYGTAPTGGLVSDVQRSGGGGGISPGTCTCKTGDPIDTATGDFTESATDAALPTYGPSLAFTRTYDATTAQSQSASSSPGPLGYGWTDNWDTSLSLNSDYGASVSGDVTLTQANGSEALFVPPVSGSCQAPYVGPGTSDTYCALPRVLGSLTYNSGSSTYTLVEHPDTTYTFNSSGELTSIADPAGATESVAYDSPSPGSGHCPGAATSCETITSASGRTLTLGWSGSGDTGTITSVTDPLGRRTTYDYSSGNLTSVTDPLGNVTSYSYDSSNANADLDHDLLTVTDPNAQGGGPDAGDVTTNTYNSSGQVTSQSDPMGRVTSYDYSAMDPSTLTGTVVVTDPDDNETAYTFNEGTLVQKVTGYGTASAASTTYSVDPSSLLDDSVTNANDETTTYTYDGDGNVLTKTNALGKTWSYSYNSFDEQTCAAEPLASSPCSSLSPPSAITAGTSTITPPGSAPPKYVTYTEYDTDGNLIYQTTGDYAPGAGSASQSRTTYDLYNGQSVTVDSDDDSCTNTAPSGELACASVDPDGVVTQLGYDSAGDLTSKSTPDGNAGGELATTTYGYDSDGEQTTTVAPKGNLSGANAGNYTTASTYDDDGEVTAVSVGGGSGHSVVARVTDYAYDADGNRTSATESTSPVLVGTKSGSNSSTSLSLSYPKGTLAGDEVILSTTTSPSSGSETVTTPSGYTLVDSVNTGQTTTYLYTHTVASDTSVSISYSTSAAKVASLAVYRGVDTSSPVDVYDDATTSSGLSVAAAALTTTNPGDELVLVAGAGQQGSAATWSAPGSMTGEVQAQLSGTSSILADETGPASAGSSGSKTATASVSGQLAAVFVALTPGTVTTSTSYDAGDEATLVTDPDANAALTCYDGEGHVAETVPAAGVAADSLSASSCPTSYPSDYGDRLASDATTIAYDAEGQKTTVTAPAPPGLSGHETTTYGYDPAGQLTSVTAPPTSNSGGAPDDVTVYTYDAAGELLTTTTGVFTATAATTSYCYDPNGDKTASVAPDGNTSAVASCSGSSPYGTSSSYQTAYSYDSLGELVTKTAPATSAAPSGQVTTYTYDPAGNQLTSENPDGVTATDTYTPLDQLATVSYSDSTHDVSYTYDADENRTAMTDASGTSSYSYNPFGELSSAENGASQSVSYSHDASGDTTAVTYPLGAGATWANTDTVTYGYDAASELTSVTDFNGNTSVLSNTADGLPSALSLGSSGDTVSTSYGANDAPSSITLSDGSTLQEFAYSSVPSGAIAAETDTPSSSSEPADYTYDAQGRVTQMTPGTDTALPYGEDASGNLTTLPTGASATYDDSSELTSSVLSSTTTDYTYDASGDRTEESVSATPTVSASYNGAAQLTGYDDSAANMTAATYDGDGLRTAATSTPTGGSSATQDFVWDTSPSVPELLMDSDNAYIYGPSGTPFEQVDLSTGTITYLVSDALGSVRGIVSSAGSLTDSAAYDAWGNPETSGGVTAETPFGFAGAYTDPSGLLYLIGRYYDPATGQFLSVDPLVDETGQPYAYTGDDPVNAVDPTGLCSSNGIFLVPGACDFTSRSWVAQTESTLQGQKGGGGFSFTQGWNAVVHVADNATTEVTSHWRGLVKIGIIAVTVVGGAACVAATAGVCGAAAFSVGGVELSGGAIAVGVVAGAGEGAAEYALDCGNHTLSGYLTSAGLGALEDAAFAGAPEELIFGGLGEGAHAAQLGFLDALKGLPGYLYSIAR